MSAIPTAQKVVVGTRVLVDLSWTMEPATLDAGSFLPGMGSRQPVRAEGAGFGPRFDLMSASLHVVESTTARWFLAPKEVPSNWQFGFLAWWGSALLSHSLQKPWVQTLFQAQREHLGHPLLLHFLPCPGDLHTTLGSPKDQPCIIRSFRNNII